MKKLLILFLITLVSVTAIQAKRTKIHITPYTVQSGDTLFVIARKHHTTTEEVRKSNGLERDQMIRVGQILRVPTDTYFPDSKLKTKKQGKTTYTIQTGDTLFTIAHAHHTTIKEVREANGMERNALIRVGQVITVPVNTYFPDEKGTGSKTVAMQKKKVGHTQKEKGKVSYTIASGDTLFTIARAHHTTTQEVREVNGMERNALIRVGQVITVPVNTYFPESSKKESVKTAKKETPKGIYEIQSGDTLFSIARKNHVTIKELMALNDIKAGSMIRIGQKLKVSKKHAFIAESSQKRSKTILKKHKIRRGDTLAKIAHKYHVSIKKLLALNKLGKKSILRVGKLLAVGEIKVKRKRAKTYRVRKGDTLWLIAKRNHTTVKKLRALNKLSRRSKLHKGMVLAVSGTVKKPSRKTRRQRIAKAKKVKHSTTASRAKSSRNRRSRSALAVLSGKSSSRGRNSRIIKTAKRYLGTRYVWGAEGPNRFDCSGFTQYVIRKSKGVRLPRVSRKQAYYGKYVSRRNLRAGDLIFFDTSRRRRGYVNHVGIYIGGNKFIHASSAKHRVVISSLGRPFYSARFKWGRRVN